MPVLASSGDKLAALRAIMQRRAEHDDHGDRPVLYVGDSTTDLECLLWGRGIVISEDGGSSAIQTLQRIGYDVPRLKDAGPAASLAWAVGFDEIREALVAELERGA